MKRRQTERSTSGRLPVERITLLGEVMRGLGRERASVFLASALFNAPIDEIGVKLGLPPSHVDWRLRSAISALRHPSHVHVLQGLVFDEDFGRYLLIDAELRALVREWGLDVLFERICLQCRGPLEVPKPRLGGRRGEGRPRRYCSNACRQKAYRKRHT